MTAQFEMFSAVNLVLGEGDNAEVAIRETMKSQPWTPFSPAAVDFIAALSNHIMRDIRFREHPALVAFGYQMRRKAVEALRPTLDPGSQGGVMRGRGLALHFAPANVDTIFLYSLLLSLLAGNANIVRLSSKESPQVDLVLDAIRTLLERPEHQAVRSRITLIRYPHDQAVTDALTAACNLRVIWGGDNGVNAIRRSPLPFLARDVVFPDRWSMAVFDADAYLAATDPSEIARLLVNDTYWFGQMACSSPRLILWRGDGVAVNQAAKLLFSEMNIHAKTFAGDFSAIDYVNKRVFEDTSAIDHDAVLHPESSNMLSVLEVPPHGLDPEGDEHVGGGLFLMARFKTLLETAPLMTSKLQTIVSYGVSGEDWRQLVASGEAGGVDRVVSPGAALDFAAVWDGMNLLREFTRETTIGVS